MCVCVGGGVVGGGGGGGGGGIGGRTDRQTDGKRHHIIFIYVFVETIINDNRTRSHELTGECLDFYL